ncbi:hypothetical protein FVE85_6921 [Porphyridium purpureum]|uniref:Transposase putative helix-turn-helix domain-containing protein n=1 Tax=Porphyridium purpureum TaxID=35688 RepID=A0A5J4Z6L6_PORPP|nr:hypothetical protein FVE85_6921 [Porphyridium purpureum]|eukprot:POR3053..scf295_1
MRRRRVLSQDARTSARVTRARTRAASGAAQGTSGAAGKASAAAGESQNEAAPIPERRSAGRRRASTAGDREEVMPFWSEAMAAMSALMWSPTAATSKEFADGVFCSRAKSTWFRVRGKEAVADRHVPVTSSVLPAAWPRTSVGEQLPELRVSAEGLLQLPSGKEIEAVEKQLGEYVVASKVKVNTVSRVDQQRILQLFGAARWTYNHCVALLNSPEADADRRSGGNTVNWVQYLRFRVVNNGSDHGAANPWLRSIPFGIRDGACADAIAAFQACRSNMAAENASHFRLGFRSRKAHKSESIYIRKQWVEQHADSIVLSVPWAAPMRLWTGRGVGVSRGPFEMDCRLQRTPTNKLYLCTPHRYIPPGLGPEPPPQQEQEQQEQQEQQQSPAPHTAKNQGQRDAQVRVVALDPSVRTFQTLFDPGRSRAISVGVGDIGRIFRLCKCLDNLKSKISTAENARRRYALRRAEPHAAHANANAYATWWMRSTSRSPHSLCASMTSSFCPRSQYPIWCAVVTARFVPRQRVKWSPGDTFVSKDE